MASGVGHMFVLLSFGLLMLVCAEAVNARIHHREHSNLVSSCPAGNYYDLQSKECRKCSSCPLNEIIRRPCHKHRDTICGPFTEFDRFNQQADLTAGKAAENKNKINSNAYSGKYDKNAHDEDGQLLKVDVYQSIPSEEEGAEKHSPSPDFASVTTDADQQWRLLALVLIGVLSLVSILLVGFVFVACYLLKRRRLVEKTVVCSSDAPATGHYFRPPVFTAERLHPTDHMRALLHVDPESQRDQNAFQVSQCLGSVPGYSDEVDENSEDGREGTSASNSSSAVCGSADQSTGFPEVVPGPSQDYVYFKAPVKHTFGQV